MPCESCWAWSSCTSACMGPGLSCSPFYFMESFSRQRMHNIRSLVRQELTSVDPGCYHLLDGGNESAHDILAKVWFSWKGEEMSDVTPHI